MTDSRYPSQKLDQYMLRLPEGMREKIKAAAAHNKRSMNAEIIQALDYWLEIDLPYDVNLGSGTDAKRVGKEDWEGTRQMVEEDFKKEIDRSIRLLQDMRRRLNVSAYRPHKDDGEED